MFSRSSRLKQAALTYAANGWPVAPAVDFTTSGWSSPLISCSCSAGQACQNPGVHPASPDWYESASTDLGVIRGWWSERTQRNVLLAPGISFDAWLAPASVGMVTTELLRHDAHSAPVACTADNNWLFFTQPAGGFASLEHIGVTRLGAGDYLVAPPSWHGALRRDRWLTPPEAGTLPAWEPVAMVLLEAARRVRDGNTAT